MSRRAGHTLFEVILVVCLTASLAVSLASTFGAMMRIWSTGSESRDLLFAGDWALGRMLDDVRQSTALKGLSTVSLSVDTQFVQDDASDIEPITWSRSAGGQLVRAVGASAGALYATSCASVVMRGPALWSKLDASPDVLTPTLGPPGQLTGSPSYAPGLFGMAVHLTGLGQSASFPVSVLAPDRGTIELWLDGSATETIAGPRMLFETSVSGAGQLLGLGYEPLAGRLTAVWNGSNVLTYTPAAPEKRWCHIALCWDGSGQSLGPGVTMALYVQGRRVASSFLALAPLPFEGRLYIGSSNLPSAPGLAKQIGLPLDDLRIYDTVKTDFSGRDNFNDLGPVEITLAFQSLQGSALLFGRVRPAAFRESSLSLPPSVPPIVPYAIQAKGYITAQGTDDQCFVVGNIHTDSSYTPGGLRIYSGTLTTNSSRRLAVPDFAAYRSAADTVIAGNHTFTGTVTGVYYVAGNANIEPNTTVNGTIICEGYLGNRPGNQGGGNNANNFRVTPNRPGFPAIVAGGPIDLSDTSGTALSGLVYGAQEVTFEASVGASIRGAVVSAGAGKWITLKNARSFSVRYELDSMPPYFE